MMTRAAKIDAKLGEGAMRRRCPSNCSALADRWTDEEKEAAATIVNDISEQIDNGEGRGALRKALAIYADLFSDECAERSIRQSDAPIRELERLNRNLEQNDQADSSAVAD